ncbi:hypothetical protein [Pseudoscardovia radai]|uniref:hypothetical protein n=1 Tax=Pseudoscardovia radai TaxID=987066 RepID=UPI003991C710
MAEDTSQKKKQPVWRKWWFWAIVVVLLVIGMIEPQGSSSQTPVSVVSSATIATSPSRSIVTPSSSSPSFSSETDQDPVVLLNSVAQAAEAEATDTVPFKPDEEYRQNGPYKRVEYRLSAFEGSSGVHATLNGVPVDMVTYHQLNSHSARIYATGDEETVLAIYSGAARVFDSSLSDSDIQAAIAKYHSSEVKDSRDMLSTLPAHSKIQSDYIMGSGSNCEIFIDAKV